jgi:UDP-N-acetylglucosamine 2-epimerase (non-hydrolysing)
MKRKIKILCVVGARPNFIKIAPLLEKFKRYKRIKPVLVHTGQHYDFEMSKVFFQELKIPKPDYNLEVGSGTHAWQTAKIMEKLEPVILKEKPDLVIVVGDVNSTLAGALTAAKLHIPVAHIEAGVRSFDMSMPEEINRVLTDRISTFLFCPTKTAVENLKKEGIKKGVYNVGDITYDTFLKYIGIAQKKSQILKKLNLKPKSYLLLTLHRPSNVDNLENLKNILEAIGKSGEKVVFPVHPRTKKQLKKFKHLITYKLTNFRFIDPVGYLDMLCLEKNAKKIITDSGGVQKEAYWVKVPCITLRNTTEWVEIIKSGWNILVATNKEKIIKAIKNFNPKRKQFKYFGDGRTAKKIVKILKFKFNGK